jgi:hypothetical protein
MFKHNRSLLNGGCILKVLKALASIISMCSLLAIFLPRYFTLCTKGKFHPFNARRESGSLIR